MSDPTLLEILNKSSEYLKQKGVEDARLDAQYLLGHALGLKRIDLYLKFDKPLNETELALCRNLIKRRAQREPLQHILGEQTFRNLQLKCDKRALIPRPETELILDAAKEYLHKEETQKILDIGAGTGAIFLSVKKEYPQHRVDACDISADCLALTRENAENNGLDLNESQLIQSDILGAFESEKKWNLIFSNPPYIRQSDIASLQIEVRDFDPHLALIGGSEGWELPLRLMAEARLHLEKAGVLILEIGLDQGDTLREKAQSQNWKSLSGYRDYSDIERFLICVSD